LNALITPSMMNNLSGVGGLIIMALSLNMLKIVDIKTSDLLPGVIFALVFSALM